MAALVMLIDKCRDENYTQFLDIPAEANDRDDKLAFL